MRHSARSVLILALTTSTAAAQRFADSRLRHVDERGLTFATESWAADLDRDGDIDFVESNGGLLWGDGNGMFRRGNLPAVAAPGNVAVVADLDGDGDVDVLRLAGSSFVVQLNDGSGSFGAPRVSFFPQVPFMELSPGDLDGDGDPDLVAKSLLGVPFMVLRNDGTGRFTDVSATALPASRPGIVHALGDVDGDGDLDLYGADIANGDPLFVNDGAGNFTLATGRFPVHARPVASAAFVDIDGDGDLDLGATFSTTAHEPTIRFALNDGSGRFAYPAAPLCASLGTGLVTFGDLDGDGDADLVVIVEDLATRIGTLTAWFNDGAGVLTPRAAQRLGPGLTSTSTLADVDGDGDLDALTGGRTLLLHDGAGGFVDATRTAVPDTAAFSMVAGDVDADGDVDLVVDRNLLRNDGTGWFAPEALPGRGSFGMIGALTDLDGDGDLDAVQIDGNAGFNAFGLLWNDGTGVFTLGALPALPPSFRGGVRIADFDHDGQPDLFGPNELLLNQGGGMFVEVTSPIAWQGSAGFAVGDVDADGELDVVAGSGQVFLGAGNLAFTQRVVPGMALDVALELTDVDGDGDLDVVGLGSGPGFAQPFVEVWFNDGTGRFGGATAHPLPGTAKCLCLADVDGDADLDLAIGIADPHRTVVAMVNDGRGAFVDRSSLLVPALPVAGETRALVAADVDRDGDADLVAAGGPTFLLTNRQLQLDAPLVPRVGRRYAIDLTVAPGPGSGPASGLLLLAARRLPTPLVVSGVGVVLVDPATSIVSPTASLPTSGTLALRFRLPVDPRLVGATLHWQGVVADSNGAATTGMVLMPITR